MGVGSHMSTGGKESEESSLGLRVCGWGGTHTTQSATSSEWVRLNGGRLVCSEAWKAWTTCELQRYGEGDIHNDELGGRRRTFEHIAWTADPGFEP